MNQEETQTAKTTTIWSRAKLNNPKQCILVAGLTVALLGLLTFLFRKPHEMKPPEGGGPVFEAFIADPDETTPYASTDFDDLTRYQKSSILEPFLICGHFTNLVPGKTYQAKIKLSDAKGNELEKGEPFSITPGGKRFYIHATINPNYKKHRSGKWKASFELVGVGKQKHTFTILPPSTEQMETLEDYEKSREMAYRAFAHYWMGINAGEDIMFLTSLAQKTQQPEFFQVAGVTQDFVEDPVSEADRLNGITRRGRALMKFTVFRGYNHERGWTKWVDVKRPGSHLENDFGEMWAGMMAQVLDMTEYLGGNAFEFSKPPLTYGMRFEIYCQDGNWFVVSDLGDVFVNGEPKGKREPESFEIKEPVLFANRTLYQPDEKAAMLVIQKGKTPRQIAKELGDSVRASPVATKKQVNQTMTLLRGRTL